MMPSLPCLVFNTKADRWVARAQLPVVHAVLGLRQVYEGGTQLTEVLGITPPMSALPAAEDVKSAKSVSKSHNEIFSV